MPDLKRRYVDPDAAAQARHDAAQAAYEAARAKAKTDGTPEPQKPSSFWATSVLYNGMIAPLTAFPIRGVIWYQGETNAHDPIGYRTLLPTMIEDWRAQFHEPNMPFLIVQLAPFGSGTGGDTAWAELREVQQDTAQSLPNSGFVVTTDLGLEHNIHPTDKQPVGERLALQARRIVYGETQLLASGPIFRNMQVVGGKALLSFDNAGSGLTIHGGMSSSVAVPADRLVGFTIAGADGHLVPAQAKITDRDTVEVSSPLVAEPKIVRYGFVNFPVVNLWNKDGLPAAPFRTDHPKL